MKRRVLAIALATLMLVALLAACGGGGSKNEGKYVLNKMVMDGEEWDLASFAELMDTDVDSVKNMFTIEAIIRPTTPIIRTVPILDKSTFSTAPIMPITANIPAVMKNTAAMLRTS